MQIDYDVGDWIVMKRDGPIKCEGGMYNRHWGGDAPEVGQICKSYGFAKKECGCVVVDFGKGSVLAARFKKLPKADSEFAEKMRNLKPHKQKVDA